MLKKLNGLFKNTVFLRVFVNTLLALVFFITYVLLNNNGLSRPLFVGGFMALGYICSVIVASICFRLAEKHVMSRGGGDVTPALGSITLDMIVRLYMPVLICNSGGKVIWNNKAFAARAGSKGSLYGHTFEEYAGVPLSVAVANESPEGIELNAFDSVYRVKSYRLDSQSNIYYLTVWNDKTELIDAYKRLSDEETLAAYIMVDNFDELKQYVSETTRSASAEVEILLRSWAESVGGIIKEYEREKYIFIFDACHMAEFTENKFDILDRIREVRVGESNLPVTVSIGIAQISGTLADKERASASCLDMALQRGGDQVVVKTENGMDFYGGKTKTVQKRTKVRARVVASELAAQTAKSSNVIIMAHRNIDFDAIGACLGMARLVTFCGIKVNIVANLKDANFIRCYDRIKSLPEYKDASIFVNPADAQDLITSDTLLMILDVNNRAQFEAPDLCDISPRTVVIDHHRKTAEFERQPVISYIEPSASSTCELISEILEQSLPSGVLTKEEADIMYAGILLDTKQFTRNTGVRTFSAVLYLRAEGASPADAQTLFKTNLGDFMSEAKFESNVIIYRSVIAISVSDSDSNSDADRIAAAKAADKLLTVDNVLASFVLCRIKDVIHISARSSGTVNVQIILEQLEGGGHYDSAATQVRGSNMTEALKRLKAAIDQYLEEN